MPVRSSDMLKCELSLEISVAWTGTVGIQGASQSMKYECKLFKESKPKASISYGQGNPCAPHYSLVQHFESLARSSGIELGKCVMLSMLKFAGAKYELVLCEQRCKLCPVRPMTVDWQANDRALGARQRYWAYRAEYAIYERMAPSMSHIRRSMPRCRVFLSINRVVRWKPRIPK